MHHRQVSIGEQPYYLHEKQKQQLQLKKLKQPQVIEISSISRRTVQMMKFVLPGRSNSQATDSASSTPVLGGFDSKLATPSTSTLAVPSTSGSCSLGMGGCQKKVSPTKERYVPSNVMPDSFRTYRGRGMAQSSDSEDSNASYMHSCECSSCSGSEFG